MEKIKLSDEEMQNVFVLLDRASFEQLVAINALVQNITENKSREAQEAFLSLIESMLKLGKGAKE